MIENGKEEGVIFDFLTNTPRFGEDDCGGVEVMARLRNAEKRLTFWPLARTDPRIFDFFWGWAEFTEMIGRKTNGIQITQRYDLFCRQHRL